MNLEHHQILAVNISKKGLAVYDSSRHHVLLNTRPCMRTLERLAEKRDGDDSRPVVATIAACAITSRRPGRSDTWLTLRV